MDNWEFNTDDSLGFLANRAGRMMGNRLNSHFRAAGHQVTVEQWAILVRLWREDGQNHQELACNCFKDKTSISRLIDNMEKNGLVVRITDQNDRRSRLVYLTQQGKKIRNELVPLVKQTLEEAREGIAESELDACKNVLRQVYANLGKEWIVEDATKKTEC